MSDPRYTGPRRTDPLRRVDVQGTNGAGTMWTWLAAIIAVIIVLGLVIGYSRTEQANIQPNGPTTTGSAPPALAPKPGSAAAPQPAAPAPETPAPERDL
jgi:hypothetical protein